MSFQTKTILKSFDYSSIHSHKNNIKTYWISSSDSLNKTANNKQEDEFETIIKIMLSETESNITNSDKLIDFYIRKNPKIKNDIIERIISTLNKNSNNIYYKALIKIINIILDLLIENFQIINLVNNTIPFILTFLYQDENIKNLNAINDICGFIGKLIKIGKNNISGLIEEIVDTIFLDIFKENPNDCNIYYAYVYLLNQIMKNSPIAAFNSVIIKNGIENFTKLFGNCYKNRNKIIRELSGELTTNFIKMLVNRDNETKKSYMSLLYLNVLSQYEYNTKLNDLYPSNYFLVSGFLIFIKKIYLSYPMFFNDESLYQTLVDNLMKCKNCVKNEINIKIEFIIFIPDLYQINKKVFKKKYLKEFLEYSNEQLVKEPNIEINYYILLILGKLNYYEYELVNQICNNSIMSITQKILQDKNCPNDKVLKCLSDLLNNKEGLLSQYIIKMIDVFNILPKIFKTPLNNYKIEFLISLINFYNYYSVENATVIILCLTSISQIICNEEFRIDNFLKFNETCNNSLISPKLTNLKINIIKDINKYLSENINKNKNSQNYFDIVSNALNLFSNIKNNLFYKDMFIFYNYKILPLLKVFQNYINNIIINIILCDFITIYEDDKNLSEFIIKNIIDSIINIFILKKDNLIKEELINIFENKKVIIEILLKEENLFLYKIFDIIESTLNTNSKELLMKIISCLEKDDKNKGIYIRYIGNYIETLIFEIYSSQNPIFEENSITFLLYITSYFKHLFNLDIIGKIMNISILILIRYEYKDIIIINALKLIYELFNIDIFDDNIFSLPCNIIYILSLKLLKECNINDCLSEIVLKVLYEIIKKKNIDVYSKTDLNIENLILINRNKLKYFGIDIDKYINKIININKKIENINIVQLLFDYLVKGENYNNSVIIMKISALAQGTSPSGIDKLLYNQLDANNEQYILEDDELQLKRYNQITKKRETLNIPIEPSNTRAVIFLMKILENYSQKDLKIRIILNLQLLIQSISSSQTYFVDIILPTIIKILPLYETKYKIVLFQDISLIISNFKEKSKPYMDDIVILITDYIENNYLEIIYQLFTILFENYENDMTKYYAQLIPKFIAIIKSDVKENISYVKLLILITKTDYVYPYIKLIIVEIKNIFLKSKDLKLINILFDLLKQIISNYDTYIYLPLVILTLNTKIKMSMKAINNKINAQNDNRLKFLIKNISNNDLNLVIFNKFLEILKILNDKYRQYFAIYLSKIIKLLTTNGLIEYANCRQKLKKILDGGNNYTFMYSSNYQKRISLSYCKINCHLGFNSFTNNKNENKKENKIISSKDLSDYYKAIEDMEIENDMYFKTKKPRGSFAKKKLNNIIVKNRRGYVNNELVIKAFDNNNCKLEKDWNEWFKIIVKSVFEQTPSNFIYICYLITEYYNSLNIDLAPYAFYTVYSNNNDVNKAKLTKYLDVAIKNEKTPNKILLEILNLSEFMERKNVNMSFLDYKLFGDIAYKCNAFSKALYYKEKDFEDNKYLDVNNLIDLYYKLNEPESSVGLIKLVENNTKYYEMKEYDKKYIWYINLHDYSKALKIINNEILKENNSDKLNNLRKYKNICLNGLCNWEQILSETESEKTYENNKENNIEEINTSSNQIMNNIENNEKKQKNSIEEIIEEKLLLSKCCADLGEWDKLSQYIQEINQIMLENEGKDYLKFKKENENNDLKQKNSILKQEKKIRLNEINKEKNNNEEIEYIPYNDLVNNTNNFQFLKYNNSLFDLNIYSSIINIRKNNYETARKYIEDGGNLLINNIKFLIKESYIRGYYILMKNKFLRQLEQYIDYKQYHYEDKQYLEKIKNLTNFRNKGITKFPEIYLKFLVINSLISPIEEIYQKYIEFANIYRKSGHFEQTEIILNRLKEKMNLSLKDSISDNNLLLNEKRIIIELNLNKCLYKKGNVNEAVENGKYLIDLLNDDELIPYNKLSDKIKSKIYGNYAIYRINQLMTNKSNLKISRQKSENIKRTYFRHKTNYYAQHNFFVSIFKKANAEKMKQVSFNEVNIEKTKKKNAESEKKIYKNKESFQYQFIKNVNEVNVINHYLILATQYNKNSYKYWNNYAMFNYQCYKFMLNEQKNKTDFFNEEDKKKITTYAFNAVNGFKHSLFIANKNKIKALENCLRFIDIFFELGSKNKDLLSLIELVINEADAEIFIGITPQLICRFDIKDIKVLEILVKLLIKLFLYYPDYLFFPLIIMKNSKTRKNSSIANLILQSSFKKNMHFKELNKEYEEFINELNKCSILYHEEWSETIESSAKLFLNKDYNGMINLLIKMHKKMNQPKESLYEINFYQSYGNELKEAEKFINKLLEEQNPNYLKEAWEIYQSIYKRIGENYSKFQTLSLKYISSKLYHFNDSNIIIPGLFHSYYYKTYEKNSNINPDNTKLKEFDLKSNFKPITVQRMESYLYVVNSKQHPRKTIMIGSDNKEYIFLLKGHEDLRQDERVIQIFNLVNLLMAKEKIVEDKNLYITIYSVIPLSHKSGLIGWVQNCDTINSLIKEQRAMSNYIQNVEHNCLNRLNPKYESSKLLNKVEIFLEILKGTKGEELRKMIWIKSKSCESWFIRTTNYSRSLAVMSIIGYILGLGDRHLNNLLMSRKNGQIIHIDFGDCFEVAMKRDKYPEKVPFRLTRMLVKALGITEIEGIFRITCEKIMNLLRNNKDSLMAILSALIHNPLISFRLMIPMIIKKQKSKKLMNNFENDNKSNSVIDEIPFKNLSNDNNNDFSLNLRRIISKTLKTNTKEPNKEEDLEGKDERQIIENEQRQIFNLYEENDEIDLEELYKIAQIVLNRINDKLNGMDFYPDHQLDEKEQVDKLIRQARLTENLAQSYLGWCPFW